MGVDVHKQPWYCWTSIEPARVDGSKSPMFVRLGNERARRCLIHGASIEEGWKKGLRLIYYLLRQEKESE